MKKTVFIFFLFIIFFAKIYSQKTEEIRLQIITLKTNNPENYRFKKKDFKLKDSISVFEKLTEIKINLIQQGYIAASIDSVLGDSLNYWAYLNIGLLYKWQKLLIEDFDNEHIKRLNISEKNFIDRVVNFEKFNTNTKQLLQYYENTGYPFVWIKIDSLSITNNYFKGKLNINKNQKVYIDSIIIKGDVKISKKIIYKNIGIRPNNLFNQEMLDNIDKNLSKLAYVELAKPVELEFFEKKIDIYLYLKKKKSNLFNGIIGFASDEKEDNKLIFTGNVKFNLNNSFGIGENIGLQWENYKDSSQFLTIATVFPYLFFAPIGIQASFQLDKELLDYLNVNYSFALTYDINTENKIHSYFSQKRSFIIGDNNEAERNLKNVNNYTFGFSIRIDKTNRLILPKKGFDFNVFSGYGSRWTELNGNSAITEAGFKGAYYWQITNNLTFSFKNTSKGMFNDMGFYENEMFKIGGISDMRGFDEKSILASAYSITTFEPQFFISDYSYVSVFTDVIYFEESQINFKNTNYGIGLGSGISVDTNAGIFSLNFAVGKLNSNSFLLSATKIHFGYVVRF